MHTCYRFGRAEVRPAERRRLLDGQPAALGARAFDLLLCLIERRDRVVAKNELLETVWPRLVVEENNLQVHVMALRKLLGPQAIATVAGRGYRFSLEVAETTAEPPAPPPMAEAGHERPSIAVLPFENLGGDPQQDFFADGMCDDLVTLLAQLPDLFVIARSSTFAYKGQQIDVRRVAQELGVRYLIEGSVRQAGARLRVNAQLLDATTGTHLWAERYERGISDLFALQDEIAQAIVGALPSRLLLAEARFASRRQPEAVDAWGHVVQARVKFLAYRREDIDQAEPLARRAIELDPGYAEAHSILSHILAWQVHYHWAEDWRGTARELVWHAEKALALDPRNATVLADTGTAFFFIGRFLQAVSLLERAAALSPNTAMTCAVLGYALAIVGRADEGRAKIEHTLRLSPKDPHEHFFFTCLAWVEFHAGHFEAALAASDRALQLRPGFFPAMLPSITACVSLGRLDEARAWLARIEKAGAYRSLENLFLPRTEGTLWGQTADALRMAMDCEPRS